MGCCATPISHQAHRLLQFILSTTFDNTSATAQVLNGATRLKLLEEGELFLAESVSDFQDWRDPATNSSVKFPWHIGAAPQLLEFVILSVNEPLPASRLIPSMDQGIEVITHPGTPQQSSQIVGGEVDAHAHFARTMTASAVQQGAASLKIAQESPLAVAEPRSLFSQISIWLGMAVVVTTVFAIVWRVRAR